MKKKIDGLITALATPFKNQKLDLESFERLVQGQLKNGVQGFVINGTTAESPCLKYDEVELLFKKARQICGEQIPLIVGTGTNCTESTIECSRAAEKMGADAVLVVVPYYSKPPQRGLFEHFKKVAENISLPVILYNVPSRTITALELDTIVRLSEIKNIVGIKEASGIISFAQEIRNQCGPEFTLLSGDDGSYVDFLKSGGDGVISVSSHLIPGPMRTWRSLVQGGQIDQALVDSEKYSNLIKLLFSEANPIPLKSALMQMGIFDSDELRLPLMTLQTELALSLGRELERLGLL